LPFFSLIVRRKNYKSFISISANSSKVIVGPFLYVKTSSYIFFFSSILSCKGIFIIDCSKVFVFTVFFLSSLNSSICFSSNFSENSNISISCSMFDFSSIISRQKFLKINKYNSLSFSSSILSLFFSFFNS
jgi:hypothetical protein